MGVHTSTTLLVLIAVSRLAWLELSSAEEKCYSTHENVFCTLPELADAASTGSININPLHLVQGSNSMCRTFPNGPYRTADGTCNHVLNYGAANQPVKRLLPPAYGDFKGLDEPRTRDSTGQDLPSATLVSRTIHPNNSVVQGFTVLLMQWGQFLDHDITGSPITSEEDETIHCCGENGEVLPFALDRECFPILLDAEDTRFRGGCMEFARSVAARNPHGRKLAPREQVNALTSFIDASTVYGSSQELQDRLRSSFNGQLQARLRMTPGVDLLPDNEEENCIHRPGEHCFLAGDERVNEQSGLMAIHTLFARVHNNIVDGLELVRQRDSPEEIFQTARKIVGAIIQNIHYGEWLPIILGKAAMKRFQLNTGRGGNQRVEYNPYVDPRIANAFSTAAFRFGHSLIPDQFVIGTEAVPIRELFGQTRHIYDSFSDLLMAFSRPSGVGESGGAQTRDRFFTREITDHLFEVVPFAGLDLVALNIQRGRDHGLPPFNEYRKLCGLPVLRNFSDISDDLAQLYQSVYKSVDDIDLFSGLMSEPVEEEEGDGEGPLVGPTLTCLLGQQFHALKFGDRFFYETDRSEEGFTPAQLRNIRSITAAHVCCQEKSVVEVQANLFRAHNSTTNDFVPCARLRNRFINFELWRN
ncbi:chorion peroxidase-like [Babylonia areolata]|uniref:chorion peroxidase-like n=1 Tax=Babylonia areolata TaxID=304850 RepID=UPI003FD20CF0